MKSVLVTGGAGFIGSHIVLELLSAGLDVIVLDNLSNGSETPMVRIGELTGHRPVFVKGDVRDGALLSRIFGTYNISAVIHLAGLKAVGDSVRRPLDYFDNNFSGTINLCSVMESAGVFNLVFSSSATVYGQAEVMPISESLPPGQPTSPYGRSKLMAEEALSALVASDSRWHVAVLRYFNPVGAHPSGAIGEDTIGPPNNLIPYLSQVAIGRREELVVFGDDYPTRDGTGMRDYIHVVDLALGHLTALDAIKDRDGLSIWNLGTGRGHTVLECIAAFEKVSGRPIKYRVSPRRAGDIAQCWADPSKAWNELGWRAERDLNEMMTDAWRWQLLNPKGYNA